MSTAFKQVSDYAVGLLAAGIDSDDTSLSVEDPQGATFPASGPFWVTLYTSDPGEGCEVVLVGSRTGNVLQGLTRGQEGTDVAAWSAGTHVRLMLMGQHLEDIHTAINALEAGIDLDQTPEDIGTFEPTKTITITVDGQQYRLAIEPVE